MKLIRIDIILLTLILVKTGFNIRYVNSERKEEEKKRKKNVHWLCNLMFYFFRSSRYDAWSFCFVFALILLVRHVSYVSAIHATDKCMSIAVIKHSHETFLRYIIFVNLFPIKLNAEANAPSRHLSYLQKQKIQKNS